MGASMLQPTIVTYRNKATGERVILMRSDDYTVSLRTITGFQYDYAMAQFLREYEPWQ